MHRVKRCSRKNKFLPAWKLKVFLSIHLTVMKSAYGKNLLLIILACGSFCSLTAQTLYKFHYTFTESKVTESHDAFMVRFGNDTGFIRISGVNPDNGEKYLVDMDIEESYYKDEKTGVVDSTLLFFKGINPVVLYGDTAGYDPDIYVFHDNGEYYEPLTVYSLGEDGELFEGDFKESKLLEDKDLTEAFVLQFFSKDDDLYKDLFETSVRPLTNAEKATTLHLVIVANTNDPDIGTTCMLDKDRTLKIFSDVAEFMGIKFDAKTIFGNDYNKKNVQDAVAAIKASPQDIVIFYYSGHGYTKNDNYQYPYMELRSKSFQGLDENSINVEEVYSSIKQKGARVSLVISDCCNSVPETAAAISGDIALTRSSSIGWSLNNCLQLFLPTSPVSILMTAAAKGELSAGNNNYGGFFTNKFSASLVDFFSPLRSPATVSWKTLIEEAKTQTIQKSSNTLCNLPNGTRARCNQHPVYKIG
jgi:hypothetical protein